MKKIVFVNPPLSMYERYRYLSFAGSTFPNIGILQLAAVARKQGFEVSVIDAPSLNLTEENCLRAILEFKPDIVGFTAVTSSILNAVSIAERIKAVSPDTKTILGGVHISAIPEETMTEASCFDIGVVGEGEQTLTELLDRLGRNEDITGIEGTVCRNEGKLIDGGRRKADWELDELPYPAWELLPGFPERYRPAAYKFQNLPATYLVTSRGCPYTCSFCDNSMFGKKVRYYSAEYIVNQIEELRNRFGIREIVFEDDIFLLNRKRIISICELLIERRIDITWSCNARADCVDKELFRLMREAGCWMVSIGIENGDQSVLDRNAKNIDLNKISGAIEAARSEGILVKGFFILGLPGETEESMNRSIEFAKDSDLTDISVSKLTPFPGTDIYEIEKHSNRFEKSWMDMNLLNSVYVPEGLTADHIDYYYNKFLRDFYLRRKTIVQYAVRLLKNPALSATYFRSAGSLLKAVLK